MTDLLDRSARDIVAELAREGGGALALTEAAIARIEARDGAINAVVVRDFDRAREAATAADAALARGERGALLGLPMTVKESHNVAGLPTTWGAPMFQGWTAEVDSVAVARLKAAGAIILGKTNVPPFLSDWQSTNEIYGRTVNPWDATRTPGGSSGGAAAALAAGMVPLEFGSDIGGSIRVPAAFCGVFGHKPTYGLINERGHAPPGTDGAAVAIAVVGPMARTADDLDLALGVMAGPDPEDGAWSVALPPPRHAALKDFRVLVLDAHPSVATDPEVGAAVSELGRKLERKGVSASRASNRLPDLSAQHAVYVAMLNAVISRGAPGGTQMNAHEWMNLQDAQTGYRRAWRALFEEVDVVLAPVFGTTAFPHNDDEMALRTMKVGGAQTPYFDQTAWPGTALLPGLPATAAPIGISSAGLPLAVQVIGPHLEDRTPIAFAGLLEAEFGGFRAPPGF